MDFEKTVNVVKGRLEVVGERGQGVAKVSLKTLRAANDTVLSGVQVVVKTNAEAAKDLFEISRESLDKAVTDGLVAVAKNPIEYLPEGREILVEAFTDTVDTVNKTGTKLAKVVKTGYQDVSKTIAGKPLRKKPAKKATRKTTARRSARVAA